VEMWVASLVRRIPPGASPVNETSIGQRILEIMKVVHFF
jgi:hypothetical protein